MTEAKGGSVGGWRVKLDAPPPGRKERVTSAEHQRDKMRSERDAARHESRSWQQRHETLIARLLHHVERLTDTHDGDFARRVIDPIRQAMGDGHLAQVKFSARQHPEGLTERRLAIIRLVARGLTQAEIADELGVSVFTVKTSLSLTYRAMGARNAAHAVHLAHERDLLPRDAEQHAEQEGGTRG